MEWLLILGALALLGGKKTPAPAAGGVATPSGAPGGGEDTLPSSDTLPAASYRPGAAAIAPPDSPTLVNPQAFDPIQLYAPPPVFPAAQLGPAPTARVLVGPSGPVTPAAQLAPPSGARGALLGEPSPSTPSSYASVSMPGFTAPASAVGPVRMFSATSITQSPL